MKIVHHDKLPRYTAPPQPDPKRMSVWFNKHTEMIIKPGDSVAQVAKQVMKYWKMDRDEAHRLAGYFFCLGERRWRGSVTGPFTSRELRPIPKRRFLKGVA